MPGVLIVTTLDPNVGPFAAGGSIDRTDYLWHTPGRRETKMPRKPSKLGICPRCGTVVHARGSMTHRGSKVCEAIRQRKLARALRSGSPETRAFTGWSR